MISTSDLNYAAILITLGLGRLSHALPPQDGGRLITFELAVSDENLERARALEQGYNDLGLSAPGGAPALTLGDFLDGVQRVRRSMRGVQAASR
jgi:hypothetical protein